MSADKYPEESNRRRFVKGVVGGAALAGVGAAGITTVNSLTNPTGVGGGVTEFFGVELVSGPAPRGMPQIPVEVDDEGYLRGLFPEDDEGIEIGGINYNPNWFQYCGIQTVPGAQPENDFDNYFRYAASPPYDWQAEDADPGERIHVDDFADYDDWGNDIGQSGIGKPARGQWRSEDVGSGDEMPIEVIRSTHVEEIAGESEWLAETTSEGFIAYLSQCTHFCCIPGFKETEQSYDYGGEDKIFCVCHNSVYDPFSIQRQSFVALPRPEGGTE